MKYIIKMIGLYLNVLAVIAPRRVAQQGFMLWCRPFRSKMTNKHTAFFDTSEKFTIHSEETLVQGYKWGIGKKKILFLHGWQSHSYRWKPYVENLSHEDYTIYALDAPGHGLSKGNFLTVPVYSSLIRNFIHEIGEVHTVVGHSLGSFSLLYAFYQSPLLPVRKVILMAPPGEANDFMTFYQKTLGLSDRTIEYVVGYFKQTYQVLPGFFSTAKFAASVNVNGIIIHDEEDPETPYHYAVNIQSAWPKSRLITTKGLGHNLKSSLIVKEVVEYIDAPLYDPILSEDKK